MRKFSKWQRYARAVNEKVCNIRRTEEMKTNRNILYVIWASAFTVAMMVSAMIGVVPAHAQASSDELTQDEVLGLQFMLEEEKLARDVYLTLGDQWGLPIFQNISRAEQTHMDAVASLLERYGVDAVLSDGDLGTFENQDLLALYVLFTECGSLSLADALLVGVAIDVIYILDLQ
jgi:hypothetical protein